MKKQYVLYLTALFAGYWISANGQTPPGQGEIVITEIMVNPDAVSDANGEWVEIWNATDHDLLMNGLVLKDAGSNEHVIFSAGLLVLPARGYWVMVKNSDSLTNGGVKGNYRYQNFTLSNTADQVIITAGDDLLIDQVSYGAGWPLSPGVSLSLQPDYMAAGKNDQPEHWFESKTTYGSGDKGSPGKPNLLSSGIIVGEQEIVLTIFPNPTSGHFILEATFSGPKSGGIRMINLLGQCIEYCLFHGLTELKEVIGTEKFAPGIWFVQVEADGVQRSMKLFVVH